MLLNHPANLKDVLNFLIREKKITESELARCINLPRGTINRITSGKIVDPKSSTLTLIANYFNISIDQLLGYEKIDMHDLYATTKVKVPLITTDSLIQTYSKSGKFIPRSIQTNELIAYKNKHEDADGLFALRLQGEAMWPYFDNNSIVVANSMRQAKNRDFVISYIKKTEDIILRQLLIDGKSQILVAMNNSFKAIMLSPDDYIIGVVIYTEKDLTS